MKDMVFIRTLIICTAVFCLSAVCAAFISNMIITDTVYYAVSADRCEVGFSGIVNTLLKSSSGTLFQILFVFLSGFSVLSFFTAVGISLIRGVTFGYSAASFISGSALADGIVAHGVFFVLSSIVLLVFASFSVYFFRYIRDKGTSFTATSRYVALFFVFSGIAVISDGARLLLN